MNQYVLNHYLVNLNGTEIGVYQGKSYILAIPFVDYVFYKYNGEHINQVDTLKVTPSGGYFGFQKNENIIELPDEWDWFECGSSNKVHKDEFTIKHILDSVDDDIKLSNGHLELNSSSIFGRDYILDLDNILFDLNMEKDVNIHFKKHRTRSHNGIEYGYVIVYSKKDHDIKVCFDTHGFSSNVVAVEDYSAYCNITRKLRKLNDWIKNGKPKYKL